MGYRSDVGYAIEFPSRKEALEFIALVKASPFNEFAGWNMKATDEAKLYRNGDDFVLVFAFYDLKWYDGHAGPLQMEKILEMAEAREYPTRYVRVGEDYEDVEEVDTGEFSSLFEVLSIQRRVTLEVDTLGMQLVEDPEGEMMKEAQS